MPSRAEKSAEICLMEMGSPATKARSSGCTCTFESARLNSFGHCDFTHHGHDRYQVQAVAFQRRWKRRDESTAILLSCGD
jgi:hypothetical protein